MAQATLDFNEFSLMQSQNVTEQEQKDMETLLITFTEGTESQQDQNFSQNNNDVPNKQKNKRNTNTNYSNTKFKARNLLTNVSHRRFKYFRFQYFTFYY